MAAQTPDQVSTLKKPTEQDLVVWSAPSRPFKRRNREFYVTTIAIAAVVGLVMFFTEGFLPVILIISIVFLFYVLSTVEPEMVSYKVTNRGIWVADKRTDWEVMNRFWFTKRFDSALLITETLAFPGRLEIVVNSEDKDKINKEVSKYLPYEEVPPSNLDKAANWFAKRLPGIK